MLNSFETIAENGLIRLPSGVPAGAHCIVTILDDDPAVLRQQAEFEFSASQQRRMSHLLEKNREGTITAKESQELDALSEEFDSATLAKGRAMALLAHQNGNSHRD